jgi:hypothetical protein
LAATAVTGGTGVVHLPGTARRLAGDLASFQRYLWLPY